MKNKIAIASAFMAASSFSMGEIVINDFLCFEGFVDMSYSHTDVELDGSNTGAPGNTPDQDESDNSFTIDQVEISWLFDFDPVTAQIDLAYEGSDSPRAGYALDPDGSTAVEQAFATYHFDNGGAITAGRYASMLGFEAFEPTGLYQFSFAYDMLVGDVSVLPLYNEGVKYTYEGDMTFFGISLQDAAFDSNFNGGFAERLGGDDASSYAIEAAGSIAMDNGLTFFLGGVFEDGEENNGDDADTFTLNAYTTFETGAWIFAAEVNYSDSDRGMGLGALSEGIDNGNPFNGNIANQSDEEVLQALLMANFAYSENASVTGRITYSDHEADALGNGFAPLDLEGEFFKYTLAHGYAFTDNLFLVAEVSYVDGEFDADSANNSVDYDIEGLQGAVELIFSF